MTLLNNNQTKTIYDLLGQTTGLLFIVVLCLRWGRALATKPHPSVTKEHVLCNA